MFFSWFWVPPPEQQRCQDTSYATEQVVLERDAFFAWQYTPKHATKQQRSHHHQGDRTSILPEHADYEKEKEQAMCQTTRADMKAGATEQPDPNTG